MKKLKAKAPPVPKFVIEVTRADVTRDHVAIYNYSYVNKKTGEVAKEHHPVVNLCNGRVDCGCEDFEYRKRREARIAGVKIDIGTIRYQCKHIQAAIRDCIERGDIILQLKGLPDEQTQTHPRWHAGARRVEA